MESRAVTTSSKAGLAWPNGGTVDVNQFRSTGKVSWYYSWGVYSFNTDLEFVPMLWGPTHVTEFEANINQAIQQGHANTVLGFNEPQQGGQSNITPQVGAQLWKQYLEPLRAQGIRLGSPAPSSAPSGKTWLQDFLTACAGGCTVDFIAMHWYGVDANQFISYVADMHQTFNRNIWVTEWACQNYVDANAQCSQNDVYNFMNTTQSFMDRTSYVERYSWFGAMENLQGVNTDDALMTSKGVINALGRQYIGSQSNSAQQLPVNGNSLSTTKLSHGWLLAFVVALLLH
ncbi:glycoside hydrolase family 128 protein [Auriscalpium vulgare]|uniref:Glycoside hydrolase family 128 protein n=1 Tax=Auriscalpium vulgare TaxID=40419 RepID=A0ACB8R6G2_9AGAM|nr:glycoside hydrolase family 128 protein [Auriscalpium vulgare]